MSEDEINNYEIRVYILGDYNVGKKSIANRFLLLKSTKTLEDTYFTDKGPSTYKKVKNIPQNQKLEKELTYEEKQLQKNQLQRLFIMSTSKVFEINKINVTFFFFPITEAPQKENDYEMSEEDCDYDDFKLNMEIPLKEVESLLIKPTRDPKFLVEHLFLFCFDLKDYNSFEKIKIYYNYFEKIYGISEKYKVALIGNKRDEKKIMLPLSDVQLNAMLPKNEKKQNQIEQLEKEANVLRNIKERNEEQETQLITLEEMIDDLKIVSPRFKKKQMFFDSLKEQKEQLEMLKSFISDKNIAYYEISTKVSFNFENFFENLIKDILSQGNPELQKSTFYDRLHLFLTIKPSFSIQKRSAFTFNDNPAPDSYSSNVFAYAETKEEFIKSFDNNRGRFKNKIFINKQGPMFPIVNKEKDILNRKNESEAKGKHDKKSSTTFVWENKLQKEIKEALEVNVQGHTLGIKNGVLNLKKERRDKINSINNALSVAFEENDMKLHIKSPVMVKDNTEFERYDENRKENYKQKMDEIQKFEGEIKLRHNIIIKRNERDRKDKIKKILEKEEKYNEIFKEKSFERSLSQQKSKKQTTKTLRPSPSSPGPNTYNIPSFLNLNKGFTFGSKYFSRLDKLKNFPQPEYPNLSSDFDAIIKKNKHFNDIKRVFGDRFVKVKIPETGNPQFIIDKLKKWEENRRNSPKKLNLQGFLNERKQKAERVVMEKEKQEKEWEEQLEKQIKKQFEKSDIKSDYLKRTINYSQVEEQSPKYTIKGRHEKGSLFQTGSTVGDINNLNSNMGSHIIKDSSLSQPKYNIGKPNFPSFTFGKALRFNNNDISEEQGNYLFENGEFKPPDSKSYLIRDKYMGTGPKNGEIIKNDVPGPGHYKIKGFAEEVEKKGLDVNKIRTKIREREKEKEKEKEGDEQGSKKKDKESERQKDDNEEEYEEGEFIGRKEKILSLNRQQESDI